MIKDIDDSRIAKSGITITEHNEIIISDENAFAGSIDNIILIFELISRFDCKINESHIYGGVPSCGDYDLKMFLDYLRTLVEYDLPGIYKCFIFLKKIGFLKKIMPEIDALEEIKQSEKHHAEGNVWNHTLMVVKNILKNKENRFIYLISALYHDIGKLETTFWNDEKNTYCSYDHENIGAHRLNYYLKGLVPNKDYNQIYCLVKSHMLAPQKFKSLTCKEKARIFYNYSVNWKMVMDLRLADRLGRISDDLEIDLENHRKSIERLKRLGIYE